MTLATTDSRFSYSGDGVTVAFSFPRKYVESADLVVTLRLASNGAETAQTLSTHYTVTGAGLSNGIYASATVTFVTAPSALYQVVIARRPGLTQGFAFDSEASPLPALNRADDRLYMALQAELNDGVRVSRGTLETFSPILPEVPAADGIHYALSLNSARTAFVWLTSLTGATVSSAWSAVITASTLALGRAAMGFSSFFDGLIASADLAGFITNLGGASAVRSAIGAPAATDYASAAEMETGTAIDRIVSPGRQDRHPSAAKAWCQGSIAAAVGASYNVAGIGDNGTGNFTVNFTNAFSSTNYAAVCGIDVDATSNARFTNVHSKGTTGVSVETFYVSSTGAVATPDESGVDSWSVVCFGDR